jgi:lipopolysaccharide export system permease protein
LHRRLSEWIYPLAFGMIAIGACARVRSHREPAWSAMFNAVIAAFMLRWIGIFVEDAAEKSAVAAPLVYLVPAIGILLPAYLSVRNQPIEMPGWLSVRFIRLASRVRLLFDNARIRLSGFRRDGAGA